MEKYVNIYLENMKNKIIKETILAKDNAVIYSKYYTSIAIDQLKLYFDMSVSTKPCVNSISLYQHTNSKETGTHSIPSSVYLCIDDILKYKISEDSLKNLIDSMKWKNRSDSPIILYARYTIRNNTYMICFYNLNVFSRRPNSELYEEIISASILGENNTFDVTRLFKMYEGSNFDFNYDITDITVLDILLTPRIYHDAEYEYEDIYKYQVKLEYANCEKILKLDNLLKENLVRSSFSEE